MDESIILASGSPRRRELLTQIGIRFEVIPALSEERTESSDPQEICRSLATVKAEEVAQRIMDACTACVVQQETKNCKAGRIGEKAEGQTEDLSNSGEPGEEQPETRSISGEIEKRQPEIRSISGGTEKRQPEIRSISGETEKRQPETRSISGETEKRQPEIRSISGGTEKRQPEIRSISGETEKRQPETRSISGETEKRQPEIRSISGMTEKSSLYPGIPAEVAASRRVRVIGADTIVVLRREILGKPKDAADAARMLSELSGRAHEVMTGVCVIDICEGQKVSEASFSECTKVFVSRLTSQDIEDYIATGEPFDKAGAYGIQGVFARYIERIDGDYNNVVGLPVGRLFREFLSGKAETASET